MPTETPNSQQTVTLLSEERIVSLIRLGIRQGIAEHVCRYSQPPADVDHIMGMIADIGDGDHRRGVEVQRAVFLWALERMQKEEEYEANHKMVSTFRQAGNSVAMQLAKAFVWGCIFVAVGFAAVIFGTKFTSLFQK